MRNRCIYYSTLLRFLLTLSIVSLVWRHSMSIPPLCRTLPILIHTFLLISLTAPPPLSHYLCLSWFLSSSASSPFPRVKQRNTSTMGRLAVPGPWSHDSSTPLSVRCSLAWHVGKVVNSMDSVQQLPSFLMEKEGEKQFYYRVLQIPKMNKPRLLLG